MPIYHCRSAVPALFSALVAGMPTVMSATIAAEETMLSAPMPHQLLGGHGVKVHLATYMTRIQMAGVAGAAHLAHVARGQALVEFLVLALALLPLFLLMPMIAKYQDLAHATQMASRYVAFEAMTRNEGAGSWKPEAQLAQEARRRFFSNSEAPIKTNDGAGNFSADQNLFWRSPGHQALIADIGRDVTLHFGPASGPTHAQAFTRADDGLPFNLAGTAQRMGLKNEGIYTAQVDVALLNVPAGLKNYAPFDRINLTLQRHTSVLVDPWAAQDPAQVESRIDRPLLFPGPMLAPAKPFVDPGIGIVELFKVPGPKLGELGFWRDVVPADRLK